MSSAIAITEPTDGCSADKLAAFVEIAQKHRDKLILQVWRMTSCREEAEDIVQEALLNAFRALPRFRGDSRMDTWLHSIIHNVAVNYLRNPKSKLELPLEPFHDDTPVQEPSDPGKSPEECCECKELVNVLLASMNEVTPMHKLAVEMCVLEELPYREVARNLNVSVATLKSRVYLGKRRLKGVMYRRTRWQDRYAALDARPARRNLMNLTLEEESYDGKHAVRNKSNKCQPADRRTTGADSGPGL